jgi:inner membrane protein
MDNVTHTFCGWILSRAGLDRFGPWSAPTLMVAANLPDIDSLIYHPWSDKTKYLIAHRGLSHSFAGMAVLAFALALIVWLIGWVLRKSIHEPPRFFPALLLCLIGAASHLFLDWLNTYGVRPLLPYNERWFYGDIAFVVDPWMWMILGGAIFLGTRTTRRTRILWVFMASLSTTVMFMAARAEWVPWMALVVWIAGISGIVMLSVKIFSAQPGHIAAQAGLLIWAIYLGALFTFSRVSSSRALDAYAAMHPELNRANLQLTYSATPVPAVPWRYHVLVQTPTALDRFAVSIIGGTVEHTRIPSNLDDPLLAKIKDTAEFQAWQKFARHPITERRAGNLVLGDMRYRLNPRGRDWSELTIKIIKQEEPAPVPPPQP